MEVSMHINTYRDAFPPSNNVEYQFIIGLLGIVSNVSASPEGREFLITNSSGKDLVQKIVKFMPCMPLLRRSISLQRLMLMILYNVSINNTGLEYLFESRVGEVLNYCLGNNSFPEEMQLLCLRILQSITYDLRNPRYYRDLITTISIDNVKDIASSGTSTMNTLAKKIIEHLEDSRRFLD